MPLHGIGEGMFAAPVIQLFPDMVVQDGKEMIALRRTLSVYDEKGYYRRFMLMGKGSEVMFIPSTAPQLLKGMGRVWVFLSHHNDPRYPSFVDDIFSRAGHRLDHFEGPGATVSLYDIPGGG